MTAWIDPGNPTEIADELLAHRTLFIAILSALPSEHLLRIEMVLENQANAAPTAIAAALSRARQILSHHVALQPDPKSIRAASGGLNRGS